MHLNHTGGVVLALIAMALYGLYMAPRRKTKITNEAFSFWMGVGILASTQLLAIGQGFPHIKWAEYVIILICGIVWGTGTSAYSFAVHTIGLSRSTPVKNLCAIFAALLGILVLHEIPLSNYTSLGLVLFGSIAISLSATLFGRLEPPDSSMRKVSGRTVVIGFAGAFWAAIAYSVYTVPMKMLLTSGVTPSEFLLYMGQGCFIGMALPLAFNANGRREKTTVRDKLLAMSAGAMWAIGSLCANFAVQLIGVAITWPLTKTTLVAVLYGAFILKEIDITRHRRDYLYGIALSILGVFFLAIAAARG